ncbi:E3 ubiquitin-protein ligase PRT1-like [Impatiens glandulifera]|uniref:E3 ubiquitin-protein ligase PRT1-like n=1 Tax=Impatiens glandulifera TaxID=253017 RepID=UPI001FB12354|nr:E3 ubiquitin-protein ligase PRT1-like [Impatiens glandulifera]
MENQLSDLIGNEEEFPDEFQCFVCLDLLYKPVVLACGHISCFWCVYKAMNKMRESQCPVCRHPYNHFPSICQLMHFLLKKLYPIAFHRREQVVVEEEERTKYFSPQFDDPITDMDIHGSSPLHPKINPSSELRNDNENPESSSKDVSNIIKTPHEEGEEKDKKSDIEQQTVNRVPITDLSCSVCKQFLYRPVVLNCGHVYCEICVVKSNDEILRCKVCQNPHPQGFPTVCLVLDHFLEENFSDEYAIRREEGLKLASTSDGRSLAVAKKGEQKGNRMSSGSQCDIISWLHGQGPKVHPGVGCDYCGMLPIVGERYKCKDCKEMMGFDLCEECYRCSSKLPGRFNQQHRPEHRFATVEPFEEQETDFSEDDTNVAGENAEEDVSTAPFFIVYAPPDSEDDLVAPNSSSLQTPPDFLQSSPDNDE